MNIVKLGFFVFLFITFSLEIKAKEKTEIIAVINQNIVISTYDLEQRVALFKIIAPENYQENSAYKVVLESTINNLLLLESNKRFNVSLDKEDIDNYLNALLEHLKISFELLSYKAKKEGIDQKQLISLLSEQVLVDKIKQYLISGLIKVSNEEIESQLDLLKSLNNKPEYLLSQISIYSSDSNALDSISTNRQNLSKAVIEDIYQKLEEGKSFEVLAKQFSQDIYSTKGGEAGWVSAISLSPKALNSISKLKVGEYSEPILIDNTYRIYLVKDTRTMLAFNPKDPSHMDQLRQLARQKVFYEKSQIVLDDFIKDLNGYSSVLIYKNY